MHDLEPLPAGFVRLMAWMPIHGDAERIVEVLEQGAGPFAEGFQEGASLQGFRRYAIDLRLRLGSDTAGITTFSKAAYVDLGAPRRKPHGWGVEISWRAAGAAPLFPVFSGWLTVRRQELRIDGIYAPPGGVMGLMADRLLLHLAANATARWLLCEIDRAALGPAA